MTRNEARLHYTRRYLGLRALCAGRTHLGDKATMQGRALCAGMDSRSHALTWADDSDAASWHQCADHNFDRVISASR